VTVVDALPPGLTATRLTGAGWKCGLQPAVLPNETNTFEPLNACSRSDALAPGAAYPPITLTAAVDGGAQRSLTNTVTVTGGGDAPASATATDATIVEPRPDLAVFASSAGGGTPFAPFARGGAQARDSYTILVGNVGFAATAGPATLAIDLPVGVRALSLSAPAGWSCDAAAGTCATRPGASLAAGGQATFTLRVAVADTAPTNLLASMRVAGGGEIDQSDDVFTAPALVLLPGR
jgi:hypothetical protein